MLTSILFTTALRAILHHKIRSFLTMLGIITGIAAIIAILAIGQGAEQKIQQEILSYGDNYLFISAALSAQDGVQSTKIKPVKKLIARDVIALQNQCDYLKHISPVVINRETIEYQGIIAVGDIKGGNEQLLTILGRPLAQGIPFSSFDIEKASRVTIIGHKLAQELFPNESPLGAKILIKKIVFTVIGILKEQPVLPGFNDPNFNAFMPITAQQKYLRKVNNLVINGIAMTANQLHTLPLLTSQVTRIMRIRHNLEEQEKNDFKIFDQYAMLNTAKESSKTFNLFLFIIAAISLLVGGIGVMNIMLVSVTERQQEIGIRKALGAQQETILLQFLYESLILCSFGGCIGIALGIAIPHLANHYAGFPIVISFYSIGISIISMLSIGLIFGYYPARKAARLQPIKALVK